MKTRQQQKQSIRRICMLTLALAGFLPQINIANAATNIQCETYGINGLIDISILSQEGILSRNSNLKIHANGFPVRTYSAKAERDPSSSLDLLVLNVETTNEDGEPLSNPIYARIELETTVGSGLRELVGNGKIEILNAPLPRSLLNLYELSNCQGSI